MTRPAPPAKSRGRGRPSASSAEPAGRERLLAAGLELYASQGYAGTTVDQLVLAADVTSPVLYHHFKDKAGLFVAVAEDVHVRLLDQLSAACEGATTIPDALRSLLETSVETHRTQKFQTPMMLTIVLETARHPDLAEALRPRLQEWRSLFEGIAANAMPELDAPDRRYLGLALISIIDGIGVLMANLPPQRRVESVAGWLMYLLGAGEPPVSLDRDDRA